MGGAAAHDPIDDGLVVVVVAPDKGEEFGRQDIVGFEETPIAAAGIHEGVGQLAAEFGSGLEEGGGAPGGAVRRWGGG